MIASVGLRENNHATINSQFWAGSVSELGTFIETKRGKVLEDRLMKEFKSCILEALLIKYLLDKYVDFTTPNEPIHKDFPSFLIYCIHINL